MEAVRLSSSSVSVSADLANRMEVVQTLPRPPCVSFGERRKRAFREVPGRVECRVRVPGRGNVSQRRKPPHRVAPVRRGAPPGCAVGPPPEKSPERRLPLRPSRKIAGGLVRKKRTTSFCARVGQNNLHDPGESTADNLHALNVHGRPWGISEPQAFRTRTSKSSATNPLECRHPDHRLPVSFALVKST